MSTELDAIEERFLRQMESDPLPFQELKALLDQTVAGGDPARADALAELLQEALSVAPDPDPAHLLPLLIRRAERRTDAAFRGQTHALCRRFQPGGHDLTGYCGFDNENLPLTECLRRLECLLALVPGGFCHNKSWGFGIIRDRNDATGRFTVDFIRKPGHGIGFAYAAESFGIPAADHPLAQRRHDGAAHDRLRREQPGELIKSVLRHYGPMNAARLQETMIRDDLVPEPDWKVFWNDARRALKDDPSVALPAKKSDPLQFLDQPRERFNADWLSALAATNECDGILAAIAERETDSQQALEPDELRVFTERLTHVLNAAPAPPVMAMINGLLMARRLGLALDPALTASCWQRVSDRACRNTIVTALPLRRMREFFDAWMEAKPEAAEQGLLELAPEAALRVLPLLTAFLKDHGRETALAERVRPFFQGRQRATADWVLFLLRDPDFAERLELTSRALLPAFAVALLEGFSHGERKNNDLPVDYLSRADRLRPFGDAMTTTQRRDLMRRLQILTNGPKVETARSMMAAWIKTYPDLASAAASTDQEPAPEIRLTSWRTWRERQRQLEKLVKDDIPANAREIGIARSYGDLRENHEYKAAKEQQTILYRRQGELERDLSEVRGTDFVGLPHDRAGLATCVRLRHDSGNEETLVILGEWDNEPALNILSCRSARAQRLTGAATGDHVQLPGADGVAEHVTVIAVEPLPEPVRQWLRTDDPEGLSA